jgi:hypothetical protein
MKVLGYGAEQEEIMIPNSERKTQLEAEYDGPFPGMEGFSLILILLLVIFPAWISGGTVRQYLIRYPWLAAALFFLFLLAPYLSGGSHSRRCLEVRVLVRHLRRDPAVYLIAAFLFYLLLQWWNSGRVLVMASGGENVSLHPPFIAWLPGAAMNKGSWELVVCFFPAMAALLMVRHGLHTPRSIRLLFETMILNASLLAIFGLAVPALFKTVPAWLAPLLPRQPVFSFATFAYPNHAGSFFLLHLCLACGLFFFAYGSQGDSFREDEQRFHPGPPAKAFICFPAPGLILVILLLFYTIHKTRCRFAIYFSWITIIIFTVFFLLQTIKKLKRRQPGRPPWGTISLVAFAGLLMTLFVLSYVSNNKKFPDLLTLVKPAKIVEEQWNSRLWSLQAAVKIWKDNPLFGVGGGGYQKCLLPYVGQPQQPYFCLHNVHNDPLQYLCELGIVGMGLLIGVFILLAINIFLSDTRNQGLVSFGLLGLGGVVLHSLVDLPFRSLPVLMAFGVVMAGLGINRNPQRYREKLNVKNRTSIAFLNRYVYFYVLPALFLILAVWWILAPLRQGISRDMVREVERYYHENREKIIMRQSETAAPLRTLWWAKLIYSEYKEPHLLSAKIYFDLYRAAVASTKKSEKSAGNYLKKALRNSLTASQYINGGDAEFIKIHAAILDALGNNLEESLFIKGLLPGW